jgi:Protein of unknown function (DUF1759)
LVVALGSERIEFDQLWKLVFENFERPEVIVQDHVQPILDLSDEPDNNCESKNNVVNAVSIGILGIERVLKEKEQNHFLLRILMNKLSSNAKRILRQRRQRQFRLLKRY